MTNQELFDTVVNFLWEQQARAVEDGMCWYRTKDGRKCAIGCLISDDRYDPKMESCVLHELVQEYPGVLGFDPTQENLELLAKLQFMHDWSINPASFLEVIGELAHSIRHRDP